MKNILKNSALVLSALALSIIVGCAVLAWNEPGAPPPNPNVARPINTSGDLQTKAGDLIIGNGLTVTNTGGTSPSFELKANVTGYTGKFVVTQNGDVGVGTADPKGRLDIEGGKICLNGSGPSDCCASWSECLGGN